MEKGIEKQVKGLELLIRSHIRKEKSVKNKEKN